MSAVFAHLAANPMLTLFLLIGIGSILGHIKLRGISLGAAAVLFGGIALAAASSGMGIEIEVPHELGSLGLALFTFAIGISAGPNFFHILRTATGPLCCLLVLFVATAFVAVLLGQALDLSIPMIAGTFAGALTNTPALAAAGNASELAGYSGATAAATVGYAVSYIYGVLVMLGASTFALRGRQKDADTPPEVVNRTIRVERTDTPRLGELHDYQAGELTFSRVAHEPTGKIFRPDEQYRVQPGDLITVVGTEAAVEHVVEVLGHSSTHSLDADRTQLDFRRITVSDPRLAGRALGALGIEERFDATISRVRRGDEDMVASPHLTLQQGDRVRVVAPKEHIEALSKFFGDSTRGLTALNPVTLGIGMALGIYIGEYQIVTPSGNLFSIGAAAGTLIVGLIFGRIGRIGKVVTAIPFTTCQVLAELGLLIFLARAGVSAGGEIATAFEAGDWWRILVLGFVLSTMIAVGTFCIMRHIFHIGGTRLAGILAGVQTQPAVLAFANDRTGMDPRVALGYAMVYPVAMVAKILIAQILGGI
ncbi:MAG: TrkA C-terminal domain-containing protein [Corynebacterium sp.]|nr:TrkA C-terminal domain-containing protein [Corynebacterium sp.]